MRVLYLIDSKEYTYHKGLINDFLEIIPGEVLDMSESGYLHEKYNKIKDIHPDVVITFDLAGFELRTGNDTLSLNGIYARMAHIVFNRKNLDRADIKCRQNLSMFTYIPAGEDAQSMRKRCPEVPNILCFPEFFYKPDSDEQHENNRGRIKLWWNEFQRDAMI